MPTIIRSAERSRLCDRCAALTPETDFPTKNWICPACLKNNVPCAMPLVKRGDWELYDIRKVFAGFRVFKVKQGDGPEYSVPKRQTGRRTMATGPRTARAIHGR